MFMLVCLLMSQKTVRFCFSFLFQFPRLYIISVDQSSSSLILCLLRSILNLSSEFCQRRQWQPTPVLLPGRAHGRRSLVGCSPWGSEESDTTERLDFDFSLSCIGEGNGNPLQCSCLENPRDAGASWAAVYGVAQSQTTEAT